MQIENEFHPFKDVGMMQTVILSRNTCVKWIELANYLNVIIKVVGLSMQSTVPLRATGIIRLVGADFFFSKI